MLNSEKLLIIFSFLVLFFLIFNYYQNIFSKSFIHFTFCFILIIMLLIYINQIFIFTNLIIVKQPFLISLETIYLKIICITLILIYFISMSYNSINFGHFEFFYLLISFFSLSLLGLLVSIDFLIIFFCFEIQTFITILFISLNQYKTLTVNGIFNYYILSGIITILLLISLRIIYSTFGTFNLITIQFLIGSNIKLYSELFYLKLGILFFILALIFKLAGFPFHFWIKNIYLGLSLPIIGFLTTLIKIPIFYIFIKILIIFKIKTLFPELLTLLLLISLGSVLYGTFLTFQQKTIKNFLICSSITHMGFILILLTKYQSIIILTNLLGYLLNYTISLIIIWSILTYLQYTTKKEDIYFNELTVFFNTYPILKWTFSGCLLSLGGLPPFIGFFFKYNIFVYLISQKFYFIFIIILLFSIIIIIYYLQIINILFFNEKFKFSNFSNLLKFYFINLYKTKFFILYSSFFIFSFIFYKFFYSICYIIWISSL